METRADGMLIYDDQLMEMAEGILRAEGLRETYQRKKNHAWIGEAEDDGLTEGLKDLTEVPLIEIVKERYDYRADRINKAIGEMK